jgi:hypothetical protein
MPEQPPSGIAIAATPLPRQSLHVQSATAVFMVRPACFGLNAQTRTSNRFQRDDADLQATAAERARVEFDALVQALREAGVRVHAHDDRIEPCCPDAVFPNNWLSFHDDGTLVLYPMLAPNRRRERRLDLLAACVAEGAYRVRRLLDLSHYETQQAFLEGTGSVVFDHPARVAYAGLSPRTHLAPLAELCAELDYEPCVFATADATGTPVYHTNVLLAVGARFAVVAPDLIAAADRARVLHSLSAGGRDVVTIDARQTGRFAGNVLELRATDGAAVLAISTQAAAAFAPGEFARLRAAVDRIVASPVPTIETLGGGSVRCMIAEVFLPR